MEVISSKPRSSTTTIETKIKNSNKRGRCVPSSLSDKFLPKTHLPNWHKYGLEEKLPFGPYRDRRLKDGGLIKLSHNRLASGMIENSRSAAFDTRMLPKELLIYKAENDPHLKGWLNEPRVKKHLRKQGLINDKDEVPCDIKEYHAYRAYIKDLDSRISRRQKELEEELCLSRLPKRLSNRDWEMEEWIRLDRLYYLQNKIVAQYALIAEAEQDILEAQDRLKRRYDERASRPLHKISETDLQREIIKRRIVVEKRNKALKKMEGWVKRLLKDQEKEVAKLRAREAAKMAKLDEEHEFRKMIQQKIEEEKELHDEIRQTIRDENVYNRRSRLNAIHRKQEEQLARQKEMQHKRKEMRENMYIQKLAQKIVQKKMEHEERDRRLRKMTSIDDEDWEKLTNESKVSGSSVRSMDIEKVLEQTFSLNWHPKQVLTAAKEKYFKNLGMDFPRISHQEMMRRLHYFGSPSKAGSTASSASKRRGSSKTKRGVLKKPRRREDTLADITDDALGDFEKSLSMNPPLEVLEHMMDVTRSDQGERLSSASGGMNEFEKDGGKIIGRSHTPGAEKKNEPDMGGTNSIPNLGEPGFDPSALIASLNEMMLNENPDGSRPESPKLVK